MLRLTRIFSKEKSLTADEVMKRIESYAKMVEVEQLKRRVDYLKQDIPRIEVEYKKFLAMIEEAERDLEWMLNRIRELEYINMELKKEYSQSTNW